MATTTPKRASSIVLDRFLGVDFANVETEVHTARSPWAPNMVADIAGRPQKRPGYKTVANTYVGRVNGIHWLGDNRIVHAGTRLYAINANIIYSGMADARSTSFVMGGKLYLLDGAHYLSYDGTEITEVVGSIPTTKIGAKPDGSGGTLEGFNLLTPWRTNSFTADGTAKEYVLDAHDLDADGLTVKVGGVSKTEGTDFTVDRAAGKVTFTAAPPADGGVDSVVITFAKTVSGARQKIEKCRLCTLYGVGNDSRVFLAGNPDEPNTDWQSATYDPEYFPDQGYTKIGSDRTAIMGYLKQYDSLIIVKQTSDIDGGLFLRTAEFDETGTPIFPVKEGISGIGAVSSYCFASAPGDQLFLSDRGVFGLVSNAITGQRSTQMRSYFIGPKLTEESNLSEAVAVIWKNYYVLCVNGNCYVADLQQVSDTPAGSGYEWYYWTNIPARVLSVHNNRLYFGMENGKFMIFSDPEEDGMAAYSDNGAAIDAMWTTPLLDGGNFMREKTISKKGTGIKTRPFTRSSGEIFFTTDKTIRQVTRSYKMDIFDFDDVDFNRFTFNTSDNPQVQISPKKFRKVLQFQMGVRNCENKEGFGILAMMISFTVGNLTRKKY